MSHLGIQRLDFTPFRTHPFFLVTTLLAIISWHVALIAQALSTAQFGPRFVGVVWFAILLQGVLTVGIIYTLASDSVATSRFQISVFGGVAIVFAVIGVQEGLFTREPALEAMAAGWFVLAIIDILWVLYFTSEEDSLILHVFGSGRLTRRRRPRAHSGIRHIHGKPNFAVGGGVSSEDFGHGGRQVKRDSANEGATIARSGSAGGRSITSRKSLVGTVEDVGTPSTIDHVPESSVYVTYPPVATPDPPQTARPAAPITTSGSKTPSSPSQANVVSAPSSTPDAEPETEPDAKSEVDVYQWKAKALHGYKASREDPNELSFVKGEIIEIEDQEGKWWQARRANGATGIVPSNYLQIL
ncbi:hypothetical protein B0H10DRAFT_672958 [Mycena sp. CBHHK59/15]|nr:hypothetical protein B0H10DRAFT_672958 [Mycena sp. CBHHK59/15]